MAKVTNRSKGPVVVHTKPAGATGASLPTLTTIQPGQTLEDVELHDPHNPMYRVMQDAGHVDFHDGLTLAKPDAKPAPDLALDTAKPAAGAPKK